MSALFRRVVSLLLIVVLVDVPARAQGKSDWSRVRGIGGAIEIVVTVDDMKHEGRYLDSDELTLTLQSGAVQEVFARDDVQEVRKVPGSAGTFWGDFGGFVVIATTLTGTILAARGGLEWGTGLAVGLLTFHVFDRGDVIYRAP